MIIFKIFKYLKLMVKITVEDFILMTQFFTRIPIPIRIEVDEEKFSRGIFCIPWVGALIGVILSLCYMMMKDVAHLPRLVIATLIIIIEVMLTGGLHIDGLADTFDGIYSARKKERILEIMKDSHIGTYGVLAIVLILMLKMSLIYYIPQQLLYNILLIMPMISRSGALLLAYLFPYAREDGLGNWLIGNVETFDLWIVMLSVMLIGLIVANYINIILISVIIDFPIMFAWLYGHHIKKYIDGITGDTLGAYIELSEVLILFVCIVFCVIKAGS